MLFCDVCDNMLYISLDPEDDARLMYHCKNCAFTKQATAVSTDDAAGAEEGRSARSTNAADVTTTAVLGKNYVDDETQYEQFVNPAIKYDPTLPRLNTIECANRACTKPAGKDNEVIYVKYDHTNLRFMYFCCFCETFWKSGGG